MAYSIRLPDGSLVQNIPDEVTPEAAKARILQLRPDLAPPPPPPAAPSKERTWGEAAKDIGAGVVSGIGSLVQAPGQLYGLATGNFENTGALGLGKDISEYGESMKSSGLKAREAAREQAIQEAEKRGESAAAWTAAKETLKDPALLTSFLAEQVPQLAIPGGAAKVAGSLAMRGAGVGLEGLAKEAAITAAKEAAVKQGARAAIGAGAVQQGADVGAQSYEDIYKKLISQGKTPEQAADGAINLARAVGVSGAIISVLAQHLPGAKSIEHYLAGGKEATGAIRSAVKGAFGEGLSEAVEEGGGKFSQNLAMRDIDPNQRLTEGLGRTAGMAAIGGVGLGGGIGALSAKGTPKATPVEEAPPVPPQTETPEQAIPPAPTAPTTPPGYAELEQEKQRLLSGPKSPEVKARLEEIKQLQTDIVARDVANKARGITAQQGAGESAFAAQEPQQMEMREATVQQPEGVTPPAPVQPAPEVVQEDNRPPQQQLKLPLKKTEEQVPRTLETNVAPVDMFGKPLEEEKQQSPERQEMLNQYDTLAREMDRLKAQYHVAPTEEMRADLLKRGEQYQTSMDEVRQKIAELDAGKKETVTPEGEQQRLELRRTRAAEPVRTLEAKPQPEVTVPAPEGVIKEPTIFKPTKPTPESVPTKVSPDVLGVLGIGPTAVLRKADHPIHQMDIANPADAAQVRNILNVYKEGKSEGIVQKVDAYLARPEFQAVKEQPNAQVQQATDIKANVGTTESGVRVPEQQRQVPAGQPKSLKAVALERTVRPAVPAVGGEGKPAPALKAEEKGVYTVEKLAKLIREAYDIPHSKAREMVDAVADDLGTVPPKEVAALLNKLDKEGPKLRRVNKQLTTGTKYVSKAQTEAVVKALTSTWTNMPETEIVENVGGLPAELRTALDNAKDPAAARAGAKAVYYKGKVWVVSDNHVSTSDVITSVLHEVAGHHGLQGVLGNEFASTMKAIYDTNADVRAKADAMMKEETDLDVATATEEVLADMAETGKINASVLTRIANAIRRLIRKATAGKFAAGISDNEVKEIIANARKFVQEGARTEVATSDIAKQRSVTTAKGKEALQSLKDNFNREVKDENPGIATRTRNAVLNAVNNPEVTAASTKRTFTKWVDKLETVTADSSAGLTNEITRNVLRGTKTDQEKLGALLEVSTAQRGGSIASGVLEYGKAVWEDATHKWKLVKDEGSFKGVVNQIEAIAKKEGITYKEAELITHTLFEARRVGSMRRHNAEIEKRIVDLTAKGKRAEATALRKNLLTIHLTDEQVTAGLKLRETIPELDKVVDTWNAARKNALDIMTKSGLYSAEEANVLLDNIDYVPFFREEQVEQGATPKQYVSSLQVMAKDRRLKGSSQAVNNIIENQQKWLNSAITRSVANRQGVALANAAVENGVGKWVDGPVRNEHVAKVWVNGEQKFVLLDDPLYMDAFNGLQAVAIPMFKWASGMAKILRNSVVLHPLFAVSQVPQDAFAAMFSSGLSPQYALTIPARAVKEFIKTLAGVSKTHEELKKYGVVGVQDFQSVLSDNDSAIYRSDAAPSNILTKTKDFLHHIASASDSAVRQAVFEASEAAGLSKAEALEKSFNVANFRNRGTSKTIALAGQVIPFFHAYIAMQHVAFKTLTGKGSSPTQRSTAFKNLIGTTAATMVLATLYAMMNGDDEDYLNKPANVRDRLLMIPGTGGVSIPLRMDVFSIPKIIAEHTYLMLTDNATEDGRKFRDSMSNALITSLAGPTPVPQIVKPLVEVAINHDFFQGREILSKSEQSKETNRQFRDSTSELGKMLGETGLISPINADHIMRGMFGSAGGLTMYLTNQVLNTGPERPAMSVQDAIATFPGASSFVSKENEGGLKADFYELQKEVLKAANTYRDIQTRSPSEVEAFIAKPGNIEKLSLANTVNSITNNLANIRKQMTKVTNDINIPAEQKRTILKELKDNETQMLKAINIKRLREIANI